MQKPPHGTGATVPGDGRIPSGPVPRFSVFRPQAAFKSASGRKRPQLAGFCVKTRRMSNRGAPNADFFSLSFGGCASKLRAGRDGLFFLSACGGLFSPWSFLFYPPPFFLSRFPLFFRLLMAGQIKPAKDISCLTRKKMEERRVGEEPDFSFSLSPPTHTSFPQPFPSAPPQLFLSLLIFPASLPSRFPSQISGSAAIGLCA